MDTEFTDIYQGLKALEDTAFPKQCATCGRNYATADAFIKETESLVDNTGLMEGFSFEEEEDVTIELYRNCVCGSTLVDWFSDRRDTSPKGLERREVFGKLLDLIASKGIDINYARVELLKTLRGQESTLLAELNIKIKRN